MFSGECWRDFSKKNQGGNRRIAPLVLLGTLSNSNHPWKFPLSVSLARTDNWRGKRIQRQEVEFWPNSTPGSGKMPCEIGRFFRRKSDAEFCRFGVEFCPFSTPFACPWWLLIMVKNLQLWFTSFKFYNFWNPSAAKIQQEHRKTRHYTPEVAT